MRPLAEIWIYPIKSLDGVSVDRAEVLSSGALAWDRRLALVDDEGKVVNGKRTAAVHQLQASYDLNAGIVTITVRGQEHPAGSFDLTRDRAALAAWLSDFFRFRVRLVEDAQMGFPDDPEASGPTLVSSGTLRAVASWFPGLTVPEIRERFRVNLVALEPEPFWEDRLVGELGRPVPFTVGQARFLGVNPCQRCVVPTRSPATGDLWPRFAKTFAERRAATLPEWAPRERFDQFYRLTLNTLPAPDQGDPKIRVGDEVRLDPALGA